MSRRLISTGSDFEKTAGYSRAVVQDTAAGRWCFISGTTGYDYATMTLPESLDAQARNALATIEAALVDAGLTLKDIVRCRYYLTDRSHVGEMFALMGQVFGEIRPAATMVICDLNEAAMKVEIEVTALKAS